jgi:tight adherence protein B
MRPSEFILLLALATALLVYGIAQWIIARIDADKRRLQQRLISEWRTDVSSLASKSILTQPELRELPGWMADREFFRNLNRRLKYAFPEAKLTRFVIIAVCIGMITFSVVTLALDSLLAGVLAIPFGAYLPLIVVNGKRAARQRAIVDQLPDALDFLTRVLRAGHSLTTGIQMMGDELPHPIGSEFRRCYDQHSMGQPLEDALRDMVGRIDSSDFGFFITAVLIQRQTGGDLSEVLANISKMVRSRQRLQQHVKAITAEGRLTGYILVAFPAVLFLISLALNPNYAGLLLRTDTGKMMLGAAVGLQMIGLVAIRKIVQVKV